MRPIVQAREEPDGHTLSVECEYLPEPLLEFGSGGLHVDPKAGIARHGPRSLGTDRHPARLRVGLLGSAGTLAATHAWLEEQAQGVIGDAANPSFPGYCADRGFCADLEFSDHWTERITQSELKALLADGIRRPDRFARASDLLEDKLRLLAERDHPPDYVIVALPDELVRRCRVADYFDPRVGQVHRDLRRAFKARAMRYRLPTQLLMQSTIDGRDRTPPSRIAWNFFTGVYFKGGGLPWTPHALSPGTCYVGVSFFHPLGSVRTVQASVVQAFDEHGEGLVLRGHEFEWDPDKEGTASPHLSEEQASELLEMVLARYEREMKQRPRRVVVHKTSRFWPAERAGFEASLRGVVHSYDLVALQSQDEVRLITESIYPPLRGTRFSVGDIDFLYTTGFIAALNEFHGMAVPSPLLIADHVGQDTSPRDLLREVLALTKINWNSANLGGHPPITLRFSHLVGQVLREMPAQLEPLPQFKYYV